MRSSSTSNRRALRRGQWVAGSALLLALALILGACAQSGAAPAAAAPALPTYAPANSDRAGNVNPGEPVADASGAENAGAENAGAASVEDAAAASSAAGSDEAGEVNPGESVADAAASIHPTAGRSAAYPAEIVAQEQVAVVAQVIGQVLEVTVDVGDHVQAGDVLVRLDSAALEAQRAQSLAGLAAAQAQLEALTAPASSPDLAAAQAAIDAAAAAYNRAANGPTDEERRQALAQLKSAQAAVTVAQAAYNQVKGNPNIGMLPQSLQLQQATLAGEAAQAAYDKLMLGATADQLAAASAQLANGRATLQRLLDGARPAQIEAAEAQIEAAENALYLATLQVDKATIPAPISGVVSKLQTAAGAMAGPTAPLLTLLSNHVRITVQVEETRLASLAGGQPAQIRVDAYPDRTFAGVIAYIAPELDAATRTVQVAITPDDPDGLLRPGMSATVELVAGE